MPTHRYIGKTFESSALVHAPYAVSQEHQTPRGKFWVLPILGHAWNSPLPARGSLPRSHPQPGSSRLRQGAVMAGELPEVSWAVLGAGGCWGAPLAMARCHRGPWLIAREGSWPQGAAGRRGQWAGHT